MSRARSYDSTTSSPALSAYFTPRGEFFSAPLTHRSHRTASTGSAFEFAAPTATTILQGSVVASPAPSPAGPTPPPRPPLQRGDFFERSWAPGYYGSVEPVSSPVIVPGRTVTAPEPHTRFGEDTDESSVSSSTASGSWNAKYPVRDLTGRVKKTQLVPVAIGGFSDIWLGDGYLTSSTNPDEVAIKIIRITGLVDEEHMQRKLERRINRELETWQRLNHPRILPLYGLCNDLGWSSGTPALIAPWMPYGDAEVYGRNHPEASKTSLVKDVAAGLDYMHSLGIVHGDLKGKNILINKDRRAMIGDFGLSRVIRKTTAECQQDHTTTWAGSIRWMAPELHNDRLPNVTMSSDVYAYVSTSLQIISGQLPFHHYPTNFKVIQAILRDERSLRPVHPEMTHGLWELFERCWTKDSKARCRMRDVVYHLERFPG